jgi:cation diffusion facilitator family transporter
MADADRRQVDHPVSEQSQVTSAMSVTLAGMLVNIFLTIFKVWIGLLAKSQALVADGIHSLSDLFSDFVVIFGLKWGRKGPDEDHPYGHARIESVAGMLMGLILAVAAIGIVYNALTSIYQHSEAHPSLWAVAAAFISIVFKEALYWYTIKIGRRIRSLVIVGNAWHHRTDALSSVAVLIGVGAVYINPDWHIADSLAAIVVSVLILKVGGSLIWTTLKEVVDTAPDKGILTRLSDYAETVEGVRQAHDIKARYSGSQILVEIHIVVDPDLSVREGHSIAKQVERILLDNIDDVSKVIIHVDPELKSDG